MGRWVRTRRNGLNEFGPDYRRQISGYRCSARTNDGPINHPSGTWTKFSPRPKIEYEEIDEEPILEHPCDQVNLCQHKCRRTPVKDGVNFQCQCEKKFKPDPD